MPIRRNSEQGNISLEEFYQRFDKKIAKRMLPFLGLINQIFQETQLWGLTSLNRLVIQNSDNSNSDWFVIVYNGGMDEYYFEYLLPERKRPWKQATVQGEAKSLEEAKKYLLIAMRESEGWEGNLEFERLLEENGLDRL
jgi:hypothetical protein